MAASQKLEETEIEKTDSDQQLNFAEDIYRHSMEDVRDSKDRPSSLMDIKQAHISVLSSNMED